MLSLMSTVARESEETKHLLPSVLIVDDAPGVADVLAIKLGREGCRVVAVPTAERATRAIEESEFDLILLDIRLPDGNGVELLKQLRQRRSLLDTPIIMISGLDESSDVVTALQSGANDYITKPFDLSVVVARIRTQLMIKRLKDLNDHFLRVASHDLKKPLLVMREAARQLQAEYPIGAALNEDGHATLAFIIESGDFMQRIVADLLELGTLRDQRLRITKRPTDLGAIVRQAVARNLPYAKSKSCELKMEFGRDLPNIQADDARLMQVLENLVGNAIKFGPAGTVVTLRTAREDHWLICEVSDTGPGIPEQEMNLLFKEYARLSNSPTGGETSTGLGLSICRELIRLHGGEIGARNNADSGATFWFRLPIA